MILSSKCMFFDFEHLNNHSHQTHRPFFFDFPTILKVIPLFYFLKYCKVKKINALFASNFGRIADPSFGLTRRDWYASRGRQVFQLAEEEDQKECRWWRRRKRRRWRPLRRRHDQPSPPQREGITTKVSSFSDNLPLWNQSHLKGRLSRGESQILEKKFCNNSLCNCFVLFQSMYQSL